MMRLLMHVRPLRVSPGYSSRRHRDLVIPVQGKKKRQRKV
ncbi:hypothetical protein LINGRAHAP2_LOCUS4534 [Linum grandiflorum]